MNLASIIVFIVAVIVAMYLAVKLITRDSHPERTSTYYSYPKSISDASQMYPDIKNVIKVRMAGIGAKILLVNLRIKSLTKLVDSILSGAFGSQNCPAISASINSTLEDFSLHLKRLINELLKYPRQLYTVEGNYEMLQTWKGNITSGLENVNGNLDELKKFTFTPNDENLCINDLISRLDNQINLNNQIIAAVKKAP